MTPKQLITAALALLGVALVWRLVSVEGDVATLRAELAKVQTPPARVEPPDLPPAFDSPRRNSPPVRENSTGYERTLEELQQAKARIFELEGVVQELSGAWNQFAAEEEARRAQQSLYESALGPAVDMDTDGMPEVFFPNPDAQSVRAYFSPLPAANPSNQPPR